MKFPNAYKGLSKVLAAQILQVISAIITIVGSIMLLASIGGMNLVGAGIWTLVALAGGVVAIIAFIINLVGLGQARKDQQYFMWAFVLTLIALALTFVATSVQSVNPGIAGWIEFAGRIIEISVFEYAAMGIMDLADQLGNREVAELGRKMRTLITVLWIVLIVVEVLKNSTAAGYISLGAGILEIVIYIVYIVFLSRAKKMLA